MAKKWCLILGLLFVVLVFSGVSAGRMDPAITPAAKTAKYAPGEVLVKFKNAPRPANALAPSDRFNPLNEAATASWVAALPEGARMALEEVQGFAIRVHPGLGLARVLIPESACVGQAIEMLYRSGTVEYAEPNYHIKAFGIYGGERFPNDPQFPNQWALKNTGQSGGTPDADISAPAAWSIRTDGSQTIVGVMDTGVDYNCQDVKNSMWTNPKEIPCNGKDDDNNGWVDDYYGIDARNHDGDPMDDDLSSHHGTGVAGVIGATGNDQIGICGVNWTAKIMALKFLDPYGNGTVEDAITCINYALAMKARQGYPRLVLNCSWGVYPYSNALYCAIQAARDQGVLLVAAAGNDNKDTDACPVYPASYNLDNIISVGASDRFDKKASFSNYGCASVDLFAPGKEVLATQAGCGHYGSISKTSMAGAHVSGACALVWSKNPSLNWKQVKGLILNGADDGQTKDFYQKCLTEGRLNLYNSIIGAVAAPAIFSVTPARDLAGGTLTLTGINFGTSGTLKFQGVAFPTGNIVSWSNEKIVAKIPAGLPSGYGRLQVTTAAGTSRGASFGNVPGEMLAGQVLLPRGLAASAKVGSNVWIFGGETYWGVTGLAERYSLTTNSSLMQSIWMMPKPVTQAGAAAIGSKIYVVGGYGLPPCTDTPQPSNTLQIFDTVTQKWSLGSPLPKPLLQPTVVSCNSKLYVFGGLGNTSGTVAAENTTYIYDPAGNSWTTSTAMPKGAAYAAGALNGAGKIWVMGGYSSTAWYSGSYNGSEQKAVQEFDPASQTWTAKPDLTVARAGAGGINNGAKVFCVHGSGGGQKGRNDGEWYDPAAANWKCQIYGTEALFTPATALYSGKVYILGGVLQNCFSSCCGGKYSSSVWTFRSP